MLLLSKFNGTPRFDFSDLATNCCPLPTFKLMQSFCNPFKFEKKMMTIGDSMYGEDTIE